MNARDAHPPRESLGLLRREVEELRASRKRLLLTADDDRRRIEHDLHEGVQQHLVALAVNLQLADRLTGSDPPAASELIAEMARDVQQALEETAQLAQRIYPPLLEARGLGAALRSAAADARPSTRIEVTGVAGIAAEVAAALYFAVRDVLAEVRNDSRVTVSIREEHGALALEVTEEFARSDPTPGDSAAEFGRVRDRIEALGGELTIVSEPDRGTRIIGSLPLSR